MADILIAVLNIWFILVLIKPSKFLFFVKPEAKWKRLKGFGCYILLSIVIAAFSGGSSKPATSTAEPVKEEKTPVVAEGVLAKDDPLRRLALLEPSGKWNINKDNHSYDSLPDVGIDGEILKYIDINHCPHIEAVLYNNTDKEQEVLWQLRFYERSKDKQTDQYERVILPPKSRCEFETYCKYKATMEGVVVSCSARKIDDPPSDKFTEVLNPWKHENYTRPTYNNSNDSRFVFKNNGNKVQIIEAKYQTVNYMPRLTIRIKNDSKITQNVKIRVVARDSGNNDIMSDHDYYCEIPPNETISKKVTPLDVPFEQMGTVKYEFSLFGEKEEDSGWGFF